MLVAYQTHMHPQHKIAIEWSPEFAYAIGLLVTDGCLSRNGRYIEFTSRDKEQLINFMKCLNFENKIGEKLNGSRQNITMRIQLGDVRFHEFLTSIGLMPAKSKILGAIEIPNRYLFDFLRGHFDGDGTFYSYFDPRWKSSYMFYTVFISASKAHIDWLREIIFKSLAIRGHISKSINNSAYSLKYAKTESLKLLPNLYYNPEVVCLSRKRKKIESALGMINQKLTI